MDRGIEPCDADASLTGPAQTEAYGRDSCHSDGGVRAGLLVLLCVAITAPLAVAQASCANGGSDGGASTGDVKSAQINDECRLQADAGTHAWSSIWREPDGSPRRAAPGLARARDRCGAHASHLGPVRLIGLGVQKPKIGDQVLLVVAGEDVRGRSFVGNWRVRRIAAPSRVNAPPTNDSKQLRASKRI